MKRRTFITSLIACIPGYEFLKRYTHKIIDWADPDDDWAIKQRSIPNDTPKLTDTQIEECWQRALAKHNSSSQIDRKAWTRFDDDLASPFNPESIVSARKSDEFRKRNWL